MFVSTVLVLSLHLLPSAQAGFGMGNPPQAREEANRASDAQESSDTATQDAFGWAGDPEHLLAWLRTFSPTLAEWVLDCVQDLSAEQVGME